MGEEKVWDFSGFRWDAKDESKSKISDDREVLKADVKAGEIKITDLVEEDGTYKYWVTIKYRDGSTRETPDPEIQNEREPGP